MAGKGASVKFDIILLPLVMRLGVEGSGKAKSVKEAAKSALSYASSKCGADACLEAWEGWRTEACDNEPGVLLVESRSCVSACHHSILNIISGICAAFSSAKNFRISKDRTGLTRTAVCVIFFIVVHAVGTLCVTEGPVDFDGCG